MYLVFDCIGTNSDAQFFNYHSFSLYLEIKIAATCKYDSDRYITTVIVYQVHYFQDEELPDTKFSHVRTYRFF